MRFNPTSVHGLIDYVWSLVLLASPWVFGFSEGGAATWIPVLFGVVGILYSLATDYELGLVPLLSMKAHLTIDLAAGIALAASPWVFGFAGKVFWPHLVFGVFAVVASLVTQTRPTRVDKIASARL